MVDECKNTKEESLKETIDVLSDTETLNEYEKGKFVELR